MAYVSFGLNKGDAENPENIDIGTDDGGAGNHVTLAINKGVSLTKLDVIRIIAAFQRRLEDGHFGDFASI